MRQRAVWSPQLHDAPARAPAQRQKQTVATSASVDDCRQHHPTACLVDRLEAPQARIR